MSTKNVDILLHVEKRQRISSGRLKRARKARELNQQTVADEVGIDRTTLSKWENGKGSPSVDEYLQLSELYQEPVHKLMALDVLTDSPIDITDPVVEQVNDELDEIEHEVNELVRKGLPRGVSLEELKSSFRLIQSFLEAFEADDSG